jgi:serine/threonine-protein kinase HipA
MMAETARHGVWLHDRRIGYLYSHRNLTWYEFDEDYLTDHDRAVLGLRFEENLHRRTASNLRLPQWFSNLLPEGALRSWIAEERGASEQREMELLAHVGNDLPGALRVLPDGVERFDDLDRITDHVTPGSENNPAEHRWRFSFAGVGLKFSMLRNGDRFSCPATSQGGDWIMKMPDPLHRDVPHNEHAMMRFAAAVGIDIPKVTMVHRDQVDDVPASAWPNHEEWAFAAQRFDRTAHRTAVHIEDLAQVRGVYPQQKYEGNFETVAALIYRGHDNVALAEFARRLTFFVLIGNGDAHLKNWSLIYRDRRVPTLSPAYDVVATEVYRPPGEPEDLGLKFGGSRRFEMVHAQQFNRLARRLGCPTDLAAVVEETIRRTVEHWPAVQDELTGQSNIRETVARSVRDRSLSLLSASTVEE